MIACFLLALLFMVSAVIYAIIIARAKYKSGRFIDPSKILFAGVILSAAILFIPVYAEAFREENCGVFELLVISVHSTIRLFLLDGDFGFITDNLDNSIPVLHKAYTVFFAILYMMAPFLTCGFILSFFKNVSAYKRYLTNFNSDAYIFSELNEKSITLAESLHSNDKKKRVFVFTDVFEKEEEQSYELIERAKELGAICFKKDIIAVNFSLHSKKSELNFFAISEDQSENISQSIKIINAFKDREYSNLYVFSSQPESELILANTFSNFENDVKIKLRRIDEVQSLIMRNLYETGYKNLFQKACDDGSGEKKINAVVVGMGQYGTEMIKSLAWICQMDGYLLEINAFDDDELAEEKFIAECPELMKFSGKTDIEGETRYTINIHSGVNAGTASFNKIISTLPETTYAFVALGEDSENITFSVKLVSAFEKKGYKPVIQTVVYNSDKKNALKDITNFRGNKFNIEIIGDIKTSFSEDVILNSEIEALALERHLKWGNERDFWQFSYNYRSSVASAIHRKMKKLCEIPGIEKSPAERTEEELWNIRILEHRRWNAYMRSEGYEYSGNVEKSSRNDLAKLHNCLVPFAELSLQDQEKDDD